MDIQAVRDEVVVCLTAISGLRAYAWDQSPITPPGVIVGFPERIDYRQTYGRGQTVVDDLPVLVLVGRASDRTAGRRLAAYVSETGGASVPARIEGRTGSWTSCDTVTCDSVTFERYEIAAVPVLAAEFHLSIVGKGI